MKNKINNWAHRNLAEIIITIVVLVLVDIGVSVYNLQDRQAFAENALKNQDRMMTRDSIADENHERENEQIQESLRAKLDAINNK